MIMDLKSRISDSRWIPGGALWGGDYYLYGQAFYGAIIISLASRDRTIASQCLVGSEQRKNLVPSRCLQNSQFHWFWRFGMVCALLMIGSTVDAKVLGKSCLNTFSGEHAVDGFGGKLIVNGVRVTGPQEIPLTSILTRFRIDAHFLGRMRMKKVVSIGEGISEFVPYLRAESVMAEGVDPLYSLGHHEISSPRVHDYINTHRAYLKFGTVEQLPYRSEFVDFIFSHALFNNLIAFHPQVIMKGFEEIVRVLKPGGEAFIQAPPLVQQLVLQNSKNMKFYEVSIDGDVIHLVRITSEAAMSWRFGLLNNRGDNPQQWVTQSHHPDFQGLIGRTADIAKVFELLQTESIRYRSPVELAPGVSLLHLH